MTTIGVIDNKAVNLISTAQVVTGSWADLGTIIVIGDYDLAGLWLEVDINLAQNVQIRVLGSDTEDFAKSYSLPILDISDPSKVGVQAQVFELSVDADQNVILPMNLADSVPFIKFQVQALTPGGTPAQILTAKVSAKTTGR